MKPWVRQLIILYVVLIILKVSLAYFILAPSAFSDDYGFAKAARSVLYHGTLTVHGDVVNKAPLYPISLSLSYSFKDMNIVFFLMKFINAVISSLIILPVLLLSREFFDEKKSMLITILVAVLPANFAFTFFIMSENLFYPLFLLSVYLIYKSFIEKSYKWDILAGIVIGLTFLTKINAVVLPAMVGIVLLLKLFKKEYLEIKKKLVMALFFFITISPWIIRNSLLFGFNSKSFIGGYSASAQATMSAAMTWQFILIFLTLFMLYLSYLAIASGIIFLPLNFIAISKIEDKKVFLFSMITFATMLFALLLSSRHFNYSTGSMDYQTIFTWLTGGRIIGRYVEFVIPLIIINGIIGFEYAYKKKKIFFSSLMAASFFSILASQLIFFPLFPINNMSLSWLGVLKFIFDFFVFKIKTFETIFSYEATIVFIILLVGITLIPALFYRKKRSTLKHLLYGFIVFFFLVSLLNFCIIYYNTNTFWYNGEQTQLGLWFNKYDPKISTILFDERDGCKIFKTNQTCIYNPFYRNGEISGSATIMGFWMNDEIRIGSVDNLEGVDYIVSRHNLNLPLLRRTESGIFLYQADNAVN